jgi:hypothetical protein
MLKILLVSICEVTMPSTWQARNDTCNDCNECVAHHLKGLANFCQLYTLSLEDLQFIFQWWHDGITTKTICPKKQSSSSNVSKLAIVMGT